MTDSGDRSRSALPPRTRGQSIAINYTMSLIIVTMLISGLFISMSAYLENERENVTHAELEVLGNRIAADISTTDRLAQTTEGDSRAEIHTSIPASVAGSQYEVTITSNSPPGIDYYNVEIQLRARGTGEAKNVSTRISNEVTGSNLNGGDYVVVYDGTTIEVTDD